MLTKNLAIFLLAFLFLPNELLPQESISIGGYFGGGVISGNTTSKGSFSSSFFLEVDPGFYKDLSLRLSFLYNTDFNSVLPNTTKRYYPFIKGFGAKGITSQNIEPNFFIEEGLGLIVLNDRTLSGTDEWDYGVNFSIAAGFDLRDLDKNGFKLSLGTEYGLTFFNTLASYFSLHLQVHYFIF
ncbi:MAG: hypothetical protein A2W11_04345 [Ignavibacteria bacterium RBG_16_35_7]|nr:MAG: hypothetical protein A2W11_04345 [Ignavibacteria bacterium RBG_16_35_7]